MSNERLYRITEVVWSKSVEVYFVSATSKKEAYKEMYNTGWSMIIDTPTTKNVKSSRRARECSEAERDEEIRQDQFSRP